MSISQVNEYSSDNDVISSSLTDRLTELIPCVEVSFPLYGQTIPIHHGYKVYSSLCHFCSDLHEMDTLSIQMIEGTPNDQGNLNLSEDSVLRMRLPSNKLHFIYRMAGKSIALDNHRIRLGIPETTFLKPAKRLRSYIVVIRGHQQPESFLQAARYQLDKLGIEGEVKILTRTDGTPKRKTMKIKEHTLVGFTVEVSNLNQDDSLILQEKGIGGKHKCGCGVFVRLSQWRKHP